MSDSLAIRYVRQQRKSLAFQVTPAGMVVRIPANLEPESAEVQRFVAESLARLPQPEPLATPLTVAEVHALVARWVARLHVDVKRVQVRTMRSKWGSISTAGTLTLADDIQRLPPALAEYVVVHELLHLRYPDHRRGWRVSMGMYVPDWKERAAMLGAYVVAKNKPEF
jgi:predicted metal-dependent hydrolase